jgi:Na+-translocating ferredoxin:NAD+ oxidoreductase subunit G
MLLLFPGGSLVLYLLKTDLVVIADRAADILLALLPAVPLRLACPVYLACFAAIYLTMTHKRVSSAIKYRIAIIMSIIFAVVAAMMLTVPAALAAKDEAAELKSIFPKADVFVKKDAGGIGYYEVLEAGEPAGYGILVTADGYRGPVNMLVGIEPDGLIKNIVILKHCESPGFGARINEIKSGEKEPYFLTQFKGRPADAVAVGKNIDAVSGATISSRIVTDAVRDTVSRFLEKIKKQ